MDGPERITQTLEPQPDMLFFICCQSEKLDEQDGRVIKKQWYHSTKTVTRAKFVFLPFIAATTSSASVAPRGIGVVWFCAWKKFFWCIFWMKSKWNVPCRRQCATEHKSAAELLQYSNKITLFKQVMHVQWNIVQYAVSPNNFKLMFSLADPVPARCWFSCMVNVRQL